MMDLNNEKIYDDIFDACRQFAPSTILLTLDANEFVPFKSANTYQLLGMPDDSVVALSNPAAFVMYRGENDVYEHCEASIFRNNKKDTGYDRTAIIIDEIKCIEFKNIIMTFPQVQASISDGVRPDFMALAQHYELNTRMVDVSSETEIAAYFATHRWHNGRMEPIYDGIGCIRGFSAFEFTDDMLLNRPSKFPMFGMQCFKRPGMQHAFGYETEQGEDIAAQGWKVYFRQTKHASDNIHVNFHLNEHTGLIDDKSWLFPEEEIVEVASLVRRSTSLSINSVREYCSNQSCSFDSLSAEMQQRGFSLCDEPVFKLSPKRIEELNEQYKNSPYGDVKLLSRLSCKVSN